jgi:hypothetical protein
MGAVGVEVVFVSQRLRILTAGAFGTHSQAYGQAVRTSPVARVRARKIIPPGEGTWLRAL